MKARTKKPSSLFDFLKETIDTASANKVRKMIKHGSVKVNGLIVLRPDAMLKKGQTVEVTREKTAGKIKKAANLKFPYRILYEDDHMLAVEKPYGMIASGKPNQSRMAFSQQIAQYVQFRKEKPCQAFPVKRLDKDLSGIMLFGKSPKLKDILRKNWADAEVRYCALVEGKLSSENGKLNHYLHRKKAGFSVIVSKGTRQTWAVTTFKKLREYEKHSLVELRPETEVKHQERVQLAAVNNPIVGDTLYGSQESPLGRLAMHLHHISIMHPVNKTPLKLTTPIPKLFMQFAKNPKS